MVCLLPPKINEFTNCPYPSQRDDFTLLSIVWGGLNFSKCRNLTHIHTETLHHSAMAFNVGTMHILLHLLFCFQVYTYTLINRVATTGLSYQWQAKIQEVKLFPNMQRQHGGRKRHVLIFCCSSLASIWVLPEAQFAILVERKNPTSFHTIFLHTWLQQPTWQGTINSQLTEAHGKTPIYFNRSELLPVSARKTLLNKQNPRAFTYI